MAPEGVGPCSVNIRIAPTYDDAELKSPDDVVVVDGRVRVSPRQIPDSFGDRIAGFGSPG